MLRAVTKHSERFNFRSRRRCAEEDPCKSYQIARRFLLLGQAWASRLRCAALPALPPRRRREYSAHRHLLRDQTRVSLPRFVVRHHSARRPDAARCRSPPCATAHRRHRAAAHVLRHRANAHCSAVHATVSRFAARRATASCDSPRAAPPQSAIRRAPRHRKLRFAARRATAIRDSPRAAPPQAAIRRAPRHRNPRFAARRATASTTRVRPCVRETLSTHRPKLARAVLGTAHIRVTL